MSDGQYREETIKIFGEGTDHEEIVINGEYSFKTIDGTTYVVTYTADKTGYHVNTVTYPAPLIESVPINLIKSLVG